MTADAAGLCAAIAISAKRPDTQANPLLMKLSVVLPIIAKLLLFFALTSLPQTEDSSWYATVALGSIYLLVIPAIGIAKVMKTTDDSKPFKRCAGLAFASYVGGWVVAVWFFRHLHQFIFALWCLLRASYK